MDTLHIFVTEEVSICDTLQSFVEGITFEILRSVEQLGNVLRGIRMRLISEGYSISNGQISPPKITYDS